MDKIMYYMCIPLGYLMKWCWQLVGNYGLAIILFTLATKIVLLPVSIWIQKNSIQMVKMQPEVNFLKARLFGNADAIAEEQSKLFKKNNYHPMITLIPLAIQIFLLMGVVVIIYHPLDYLFGCSESTINALADYFKIDKQGSGFQLEIIRSIINGAEVPSGTADASLIEKIKSFQMTFCGFDLSMVPSSELGKYLLVPAIAGVSAWYLCFAQNRANVIQREQGKFNKIGLMSFSVVLSLYLGFGVPAGIALYWIASNLMAVLQMYILNAAINPKKYVDYAALEESRKALAEVEALEKEAKNDVNYKANKLREKEDVKKLNRIANKHLVIYSEKSGFYKYFKDLIDELLKRSNITINYITNDPNDIIFEKAKEQPRIKPYYIGMKKLVTVMMWMESEIVVMTTPDLNKLQLKRSHIKKDTEYIYIPHDMMSMNMGFREGALDAFDIVFCTGEHIEREVRATEKYYGLPEKTLVHFGYPLADQLIEAGKAEKAKEKVGTKKEILIAPSWQEDNLLDSCLDTLIDKLYSDKYHITVRPHPEYVKRYKARMQNITDKYADKVGDKLSFELDFSANKSIYSSDLMITDWSGVGPEFCFATGRPAIFVNTKMKCLNPNWDKIGCTPVEISLRNELGVSLDKEQLGTIDATVEKLLSSGSEYEERIAKRFDAFIYNHGTAAAEGAKYILYSLKRKKGKQQSKINKINNENAAEGNAAEINNNDDSKAV